jgi:hypothetical protein
VKLVNNRSQIHDCRFRNARRAVLCVAQIVHKEFPGAEYATLGWQADAAVRLHNFEFITGFVDIDRRLPSGLPDIDNSRSKELSMQPVSPIHYFASFRPHPGFKITYWHNVFIPGCRFTSDYV